MKAETSSYAQQCPTARPPVKSMVKKSRFTGINMLPRALPKLLPSAWSYANDTGSTEQATWPEIARLWQQWMEKRLWAISILRDTQCIQGRSLACIPSLEYRYRRYPKSRGEKGTGQAQVQPNVGHPMLFVLPIRNDVCLERSRRWHTIPGGNIARRCRNRRDGLGFGWNLGLVGFGVSPPLAHAAEPDQRCTDYQ